jgi:hypothetical protein
MALPENVNVSPPIVRLPDRDGDELGVRGGRERRAERKHGHARSHDGEDWSSVGLPTREWWPLPGLRRRIRGLSPSCAAHGARRAVRPGASATSAHSGRALQGRAAGRGIMAAF